MQIAVISSFVLAYCIVMMLFWRKVQQAEHLNSRIETITRIGRGSTVDANELSLPFSERFLKPAMQGIMKLLTGLMPQTENTRLASSLKLAGISMKTGEYNALRLIIAIGMSLFFFLLGLMAQMPAFILNFFGGGATARILMPFLFGISGLVLGLVFMRYMMVSKTRVRKQAIQKQLPEVLDLLSVSVEAGLGFDAALQRISDRAAGPLISELNATYREITLGRPRTEALRNFEQRCGLEEIKSFVAAIIQAEQLGISLKNVLKSQAQQMRLLKRQKVEEKAMKAPVKIMIPLVFFVFPVLLIILMGPAVISIINMKGVFGG